MNERMMRRKKRVSSKIHGTNERPRICVFRSNRYMYVQAIDDVKRISLTACSSKPSVAQTSPRLRPASKAMEGKIKKTDAAREAGKKLAVILMEKKITIGVFDRGRYAYNGRVKAVAEGMREKGFTI